MTVAVNVTLWFQFDGLAEVPSVVVVPAVLTFCVTVDDVLPTKLLEPLYVAVIECAAAAPMC